MRPEQKIVLSCRQTGEGAERLQEWLDQSRLMIKSQSRALRTEVQGIASELLCLMEAVEHPTTAGILGAWGSQRADLIGALLAEASLSATEDETRTVLGRDRVLTLMPRDSDGGQAASLRFVSSARTESPYRFPIRIGLLSQLDLVKIIACAYVVHVPLLQQQMLAPDVVAQRLAAKIDQLGAQSFSGMSQRDIDGVRDTVHAAAPESPALRQLDACGYWDTLGGLIPHLPDAARRRAFSLLWGGDPALTALFERLSDAIELLGFSGEAFAGLEALTGRDPITGWNVRHEDSIVATATLAKCFEDPSRTLRVSSRHGRATDVERFAMTALASDARLPIDASALPLLETTDLLVLPAPTPVLLWPPLDVKGQPVALPARRVLTPLEAIEIFAARKAAYLTDRAIRRHELTSLLVVTDMIDGTTGSELDVVSTENVAAWVELTQGETAHARERRRSGLSILAAEAGEQAMPRDNAFGMSERLPRLTATIEAVFNGNADWAAEWTPSRPFNNVFTWRPPRVGSLSPHEVRNSSPSEGPAGGSAEILSFSRARTADAGLQAAELAVPPDLSNLLHTVTQATSATIHNQHLSARLVELRRALTGRFLRLHISNDPIGIVEWRRQVCHVARNRLDRAASLGGFGRLQRALMFTEGEVLATLARLKVEDPRFTASNVIDLRTIEPQRIVEAVIETWNTAMRQATRSPALMRSVCVPGTIVAHIIDELAIGAVRIGLQEKLTEAVRRIQLSAERAIDCEYAVAALIARGINAYVETLDPGARGSRPMSMRDTRFGMSAGNATTAAPATPAAKSVASLWAETFVDLVEANILGAGLLGGAGHLNRELGEVLSAISAQSYEGLS